VGVRAVDLDRADGPVIQLSTKTYRPEDARCCPSMVGYTAYRLKANRLTEIKAPSGPVASNGAPPLHRARRRHR
jgi:hypothetical protein